MTRTLITQFQNETQLHLCLMLSVLNRGVATGERAWGGAFWGAASC